MVVGGIIEDVVHVATGVLDDQSAQHAVREGELRAIDARTALCVCYCVSLGTHTYGWQWDVSAKVRSIWQHSFSRVRALITPFVG